MAAAKVGQSPHQGHSPSFFRGPPAGQKPRLTSGGEAGALRTQSFGRCLRCAAGGAEPCLTSGGEAGALRTQSFGRCLRCAAGGAKPCLTSGGEAGALRMQSFGRCLRCAAGGAKPRLTSGGEAGALRTQSFGRCLYKWNKSLCTSVPFSDPKRRWIRARAVGRLRAAQKCSL